MRGGSGVRQGARQHGVVLAVSLWLWLGWCVCEGINGMLLYMLFAAWLVVFTRERVSMDRHPCCTCLSLWGGVGGAGRASAWYLILLVCTFVCNHGFSYIVLHLLHVCVVEHGMFTIQQGARQHGVSSCWCAFGSHVFLGSAGRCRVAASVEVL